MKEQLETMRRQHDELRGLAITYEQELDRPSPDLSALSKCRWTLARLVSGHLAYEGAHLYPALASRDGTMVEIGRKMATEIAELGMRLQNHVREWTPGAIADDWAGYRRSSKELIAVLRARMDAEESELYPLLTVAKAA
jgi:hypothetical protein